jgi:hypothetical protein
LRLTGERSARIFRSVRNFCIYRQCISKNCYQRPFDAEGPLIAEGEGEELVHQVTSVAGEQRIHFAYSAITSGAASAYAAIAGSARWAFWKCALESNSARPTCRFTLLTASVGTDGINARAAAVV